MLVVWDEEEREETVKKIILIIVIIVIVVVISFIETFSRSFLSLKLISKSQVLNSFAKNLLKPFFFPISSSQIREPITGFCEF